MQVEGVSLDLTLIMHEQAFGDYLTDHSFSLFGKCGLENRLVKPQTTKFLVSDEHSHIEYDEHSHIEYIDYLKNCVCFQYV